MEVTGISGCPYEDSDDEVLNLRIRLEENERLAVGDTIVIPMMDGSTLEREIMILSPKYAGDYAAVSKKTAQKVASGE